MFWNCFKYLIIESISPSITCSFVCLLVETFFKETKRGNYYILVLLKIYFYCGGIIFLPGNYDIFLCHQEKSLSVCEMCDFIINKSVDETLLVIKLQSSI